MHRALRMGWLMTVWAACAACSSSNGSSGPTDGGESDATGTSPESGGSAGPGADASGPAPVTCGNHMCTAPAAVLVPLTACCQSDNTCGASVSAGGLGGGAAASASPDGGTLCLDTAPGTADSMCPSTTAMGFPLRGCCSRFGLCGYDLSTIGLGCNPFAGLPGTSPSDAGPIACGGDGGTMATGDGSVSDGATTDGSSEAATESEAGGD
jgi:hypothetical protein